MTVNSMEQKTRVFCQIDIQEFNFWRRVITPPLRIDEAGLPKARAAKSIIPKMPSHEVYIRMPCPSLTNVNTLNRSIRRTPTPNQHPFPSQNRRNNCAGILKQSILSRNRVGTGLPPARLHRLAELYSLESIPALLKSLKLSSLIPFLFSLGEPSCDV